MWVRWESSGRAVFYRARYYDPTAGRFLSEDPIRFRAGDQNFYRYVGNNPLNFTDPLGLQARNPGQAVGEGPGAVSDYVQALRQIERLGNEMAALEDFEEGLEPGEEVDVLILTDPVTLEVLDVVPADQVNHLTKRAPRMSKAKAIGKPKFSEAPDSLPDPNNRPLCNTCPCQPGTRSAIKGINVFK